ncbi:MAG: regulatory protein RecX [Actinomycetota bacterium]
MLSSVDSLEERGRNILLRLLEKGPKTSGQLLEALAKAEIPQAVAKSLVQRFQEVELLNDERYAADVASATRKSRGLGRSMVSRKLAEKGLDREIIDRVVSEISDEDELATAIDAASKRIRALGNLDPETRKRRLVGFLQRRGYSSSIVFEAIREAEAQAVKSEA